MGEHSEFGNLDHLFCLLLIITITNGQNSRLIFSVGFPELAAFLVTHVDPLQQLQTLTPSFFKDQIVTIMTLTDHAPQQNQGSPVK